MFFPVIFQWGPILDFWCTQLNSRFKLEQFKIQTDQFKFNATQSTQFISECISNAACHFVFLGASGDVKIVDWKEPAFRVAVQTGFQGEAVRRIDDKKRFFLLFSCWGKKPFLFQPRWVLYCAVFTKHCGAKGATGNLFDLFTFLFLRNRLALLTAKISAFPFLFFCLAFLGAGIILFSMQPPPKIPGIFLHHYFFGACVSSQTFSIAFPVSGDGPWGKNLAEKKRLLLGWRTRNSSTASTCMFFTSVFFPDPESDNKKTSKQTS